MSNENGKLHMCQMCGKRPATVFIKNSYNGKKIEKELCSECAAQLQDSGMLQDIFASGVNDLFSSIMGMPLYEEEMPRYKGRTCPNCGMTERQIRESYSFGCSECYKTFADLAKEFVSRMGGTAHKGRAPKGYKGLSGGQETIAKTAPVKKKELSVSEQIEELEHKMKQAAAEEDYDSALNYKKQIEELKRRG